jgi:hypothetical protein
MVILSLKYYMLGPILSSCGTIISWTLNKKRTSDQVLKQNICLAEFKRMSKWPSLALSGPHVLARVCEIWRVVGIGSDLFLCHVQLSECNVAMRLLFPLFLATKFLMCLTYKVLGCWSLELWVAMTDSMTRKAMIEISFIGCLKQTGDPPCCECKCTSSNWWGRSAKL